MESQFTSRPEHKNEFQKSVVFQDAVYPDAKYCYMAIATDEQNARKAALTTDLSTYSSELVTDFILGRASFDDWDQYIAQMQELGLDELIEMRQAKGYEDLFTLRVPFLIDSAVYESAAALRRGDEIVAIDDARGLEYSGYQQYLKTRAGGEVTLTVKREGDMLLQIAVPVSDEGKLGVIARNPYTLRTQEYTFWQSIPAGIEKAGKVISSYWEQLKMIVQPKTKMYEELGGFIAIGSIFPGDWNWEDFWLKTAFLSIILAVMNILPIPGLDGGHAIFTFWEMVTGRKVSDKVLEAAQYVGLIIILFLLLYANGNDIYRFFIK